MNLSTGTKESRGIVGRQNEGVESLKPRSKAKSVLVTGGSGFIGRHLVRSLLVAGYDVTVLDSARRIPRAQTSSKIRYVRGDILDDKAAASAIRGVGSVIHLAATTGTRAQRSRAEFDRVNVEGTEAILRAGEESALTRFVFASSLAVYGERANQREAALSPVSSYGMSKLEAERVCENYSRRAGVAVAALRFANVYGKGMRTDGPRAVVAEFRSAVKAGRSLRVFGDGRQTRDFIHVTDIVDATVKALEKTAAGFRALDVGTGVPTRISDLADLFIRISGKALTVSHVPGPDEIRHSFADTEPAENLIGFRAKVSLERGVSELLGKSLAAENPTV